MAWHDVADASSLEEGQPQLVVVADRPVMLLLQRGALVATDAVCPHKFTMLTDGEVHDGAITCPMHEATFDLESGRPQEGCEWAGVLPVHKAKIEAGRVLVSVS